MNRKIQNIFRNWGIRVPNNRISNIEKLDGIYEIYLRNNNGVLVTRKIDNEIELIQRVSSDIDIYEEGNDRLIKELSEVSASESIMCNYCEQLYTDDDIGNELYELSDGSGDFICNDCFDDHAYICELCGNTNLYDDGGRYIEGANYYVCDTCWDRSDNYEYCQGCDANYKISRGHYRGDTGEWFCEGCTESHLFQCSGCDNYFSIREDEHHVTINDADICGSCYDDNYESCDWCGLVDYVDDITYVNNNNRLCSYCANLIFQCSRCYRLDKNENKHTVNGKDYCRVCSDELLYDADNKEEFKTNRKFESIINESADVESKLLSIFTKYGYTVPEETNIISVKPHEDAGYLLVRKIEKDGREKLVKLKISKILTDFFPGIDLVGDQKVQDMINEIKAVSELKKNPYTFEVYNDISYWYKELYLEYGIDSCVVWDGRAENGGTDRILHGLDNNPNIKIVVIKENSTGNYIGRALLWDGVMENGKPLGAPYLDRTYPSGNDKIHGLFIQWADTNGYFHMDSMSHDSYVNGSKRKLSFDMKQTAEDVKIFPYMDSFYNAFVDLETENVVLYDYIPDFYYANGFKNKYKYYSLQYQNGTAVETVFYCYSCGINIGKTGIKHEYGDNFLCDECIKNYKRCISCNYIGTYYENDKNFRRGHINKIGEDFYCVNCARDKYGYCKVCGNINIDGDELHDVIGKDMLDNPKTLTVCTECRERNYPKCSICKKHARYYSRMDDKYICYFCKDNIPKCSKCGSYQKAKDLRWRKKDINVHYCEDCWKDQESRYDNTEDGQEQLRKMRVFYTKYDDLKPELKKQIDTEYPGIIIEKHIQDYYMNFLKEGKYEN